MKETNPISPESIGSLLSAYYDNSLSSQQRQLLEERAQSDPFLADAMEGFDQFPEALSEIPTFETSAANGWKWALGGGIVVIAIGLVYVFSLFTQNSPIPEPNIAQQTVETPAMPLADTVEKFVGMDNEMEEKSLPKSVMEQTSKQKQLKTAEPRKQAKREQIELPKMDLSPREFEEKIDYSVKKAKTKAIGFFGFLAVDYSTIYTSTLETEREFTGTAASQANLKENNSVLETEFTRNVYTYKEFLKQSCYFMKERNFGKAIQNFSIILDQFPKDVNAEFYLGYCHYELGNYTKAIPFFEQAVNNGFDFFEEDAQWFIANSYENLGNKKEANKRYQEIKKKGGYYSFRLK